jgi:hypothetical protein
MQLLAMDPNEERYRVRPPPGSLARGAKYMARAKTCVDRAGSVEYVRILGSTDADLDPLVVANLKTWKFTPYKAQENSLPFCTAITYALTGE